MPQTRATFVIALNIVVLFLALGRAPAVESHKTTFSSLPVTTQSNISAAIGRDIPSYRVQSSANSLHAENAHQKLSMDFTISGIEVCTGQARFSLQPRAYGYGETLRPLRPVAPRAVANRVEYRRDEFTEWYINGPIGLEQGFTVQRAPGTAHGEPLTVALALAGNLAVTVDPNRTALSLTGKTTLKYSGLSANDSEGKKLHAWLELQGNRLLVRVDDAAAVYPLTVDPWIQSAKLTGSDGQPGDLMGYSVAIDGDTVVVGANAFSQNRAYVFVKPSSGWKDMTETAMLQPSDQQSRGSFGISVSINGDTIAVAAPSAKGKVPETQGAIYVFVKPASGWRDMKETAKLTVYKTRIAFPVALSKRLVAIVSNNSVYLFVKPNTGWQTRSHPNTTLQLDGFSGSGSNSLSIGADTVAVGAPNAFSGEGAVYLFVKPASGWPVTMNPTARLVGSNGLSDAIGQSVVTNGEIVFAGAPSANQNRGAVYAYVRPSSGWSNMTETAVLSAGGTVYLGDSVSMNGKSVVAGAPYATVGSNPFQGAAFIFVRPPAGWRTTSKANAKLVAGDGATNDQFATSVGISGLTIVSGSPNAAIGSNLSQGAAYVFGR